MAENVKVAVRVRPFNDREKQLKSTLVLKMAGQQTHIYQPEELKKAGGFKNCKPNKSFLFDYSYWSHDGFKVKEDGYFEPTDSKYADQKKVFSDLGRGVLNNAWEGYNCSLFAYGQTGSGKSYSMVGYSTNKGIVPVSCEELFNGIQEKRKTAGTNEEYQVTFSMLEIYNEQVRDLLNPKTFDIKGGLKVRENAAKGMFFVEGVKPVPVNSYNDIKNMMDKGTKNRTVATTKMNSTSSRAHTLVSVSFTQKRSNSGGRSMTKTSVINLVDLAGSERASATEAKGDRFKEGTSINQSLTMLGRCISALAEVGKGKKNVKVPYRDSKLTMLLKNALSGNSKTVMIAALSPASDNFEETLSTLRFADRVKSLKTKAVVNESPTDKLIRELREENARLMAELKNKGDGGAGSDERVEDLMAQLEELKSREGMQNDWEQKLKEREEELQKLKEEEEQQEIRKQTVPHLWNLHEDPSLTAKILHFIPEGKHSIGNKKADPAPDIQINGLGIQPNHAVLENKKGTVTLTPGNSAKLFLNGTEITQSKELHHHDRLLFGTSNLFVFHHPVDYARNQKEGDKATVTPPTYEAAQEELAEVSGLRTLLGNSGAKSKEDLLLQEDLLHLWPMVAQANTMSEELNKNVKFEFALVSPQARGRKHGRTEVFVKLKDLSNGNEFLFDRNKFMDRKYLMDELYNNYIANTEEWDVPKEADPFWEDPNNPEMVGCVQVYLQALAHVVEYEESLQVTDYRGSDMGRMFVEIYPCDKNGKDLDEDSDAFVENPSEQVGSSLFFKIRIVKCRGLPQRFTKTFCKYKFYLEDSETVTEEIGGTSNPDFKHERILSYNPVTKQFIDFLTTEPLVIEVWGKQRGAESNNNLNTKELMIRERTASALRRSSASDADLLNKLKAEIAFLKKKSARAEFKLNKVKNLAQAARKENQESIPLDELEDLLRSGHRLKGVAKVVYEMERAKRLNSGQVNSQACVIQ